MMDLTIDVDKLDKFLNSLNNERSSNTRDECEIGNEPAINLNPNNVLNRHKKLLNLQKSLDENTSCLSLLNEMESSLEQLLQQCVTELKLVNARIYEGSSKRNKGMKECYVRRTIRKPYFKDAYGYSHTSNDDVSKREAQGYLNYYELTGVIPRQWTKHEASIVQDNIRKAEELKWTDTLKLCGMLKHANVKNMSLSELVEERYDEYDWLKISVTSLKNAHNPQECRSLWFNCLHPQINQNAWTREEIKKLKILVKEFNNQNWDAIARRLGTKRSAFQCIYRFKRLVYNAHKYQWTEQAKRLLQNCVELFRFKNFIPWKHVATYMECKSNRSIYEAWKDINNLGNHGYFSFAEDLIIVAGMKFFGNDYVHISEYVPHRTTTQVRCRIPVLQERQFPKRAWSPEEDGLLKCLVDKYGFGNWNKVSTHFINRTPASVRCRYVCLQKDSSCGSYLVRTPVRSTDPVILTGLWEFFEDFCQEFNICNSINNVEKGPDDIMSDLSRMLLSENCSKKVNEKLTAVSDLAYRKFFDCTNNIGSHFWQKEDRKISKSEIISLLFESLLILKLLNAEIHMPSIHEISKDRTISECDKRLIKYLVKKIAKGNASVSDIFTSQDNVDFILNANKNLLLSSQKCKFLFPLNLSTLFVLRSLIANEDNLSNQAQGLTTQINNIEWKEMNTSLAPQVPHGHNYKIADKLWNVRICRLLSFNFGILNSESPTTSS